MAKGSKKQMNKLRKEAKTRIHNLQNPQALEYIAGLNDSWLPQQVTNIPGIQDQEVKKFLVCFDYLDDDECKLDSFNTGNARGLLTAFKKITACEVRKKKDIIKDKINNTSPYDSLFRKLSPEVDLYEIGFSGSGRIFFFHIEEKLNVVSIETIHRDIYK